MRYATGDNEGNGNDGNNREGGNDIIISNDTVDDEVMDNLQSMFVSNNHTVVHENINDNNNNQSSLQEICNLEFTRYVDWNGADMPARGKDLLLPWQKKYKHEFPNLAKLAKRVLAVQAASAFFEQIFSKASLII